MFCCWDATISVRKTFVFWPKGAQGAGAIESAAGAERRLGEQQAFLSQLAARCARHRSFSAVQPSFLLQHTSKPSGELTNLLENCHDDPAQTRRSRNEEGASDGSGWFGDCASRWAKLWQEVGI
jgi:hypothetical protein